MRRGRLSNFKYAFSWSGDKNAHGFSTRIPHYNNSCRILPVPHNRHESRMPQSADKYDVVIIGAGPVGLLASLCFSKWGYEIKHIDNRPLPTKTGRADGIQPRSLELLRNLGIKRRIMAHDPARVYDVAFWDPLPDGRGIHRTGSWPSCPSFIDTRYPFTTLLHQGHIERAFIEELTKHGGSIDRPWTIVGFKNDGEDKAYPVEVTLKDLDTNVEQVSKAKYLFSGEGAKSFIREQLGIKIIHKDPISHVWGVMDGVVRTNFPDILTKCTIHSDSGSVMVIPRENNMVRLYVQISSSTDADWSPRKTATVSEVQQAAKRIFQPYHLEWDRVEWYSVYPIGQGIAERYTLDHRIFIGGDACHTHSPKAGQGMNTAFHDALNFAWKVHMVEQGFAKPSILNTYESERKLIAETLLNFDAKYAALFSSRPPSAAEVGAASNNNNNNNDDDDDATSNINEFVDMFKSACEFTSGYGVVYQPNIFNWGPDHPAKSPLFNPPGVKLVPGRVFPSCTVTRLSDSNKVALEQAVPANGSFRIHIFAGNPDKTRQAVNDFASNLEKKRSFLSSYQRRDIDTVSHFERHNPHSHLFTFCLTYSNTEGSGAIDHLPKLLKAYRHHIYVDNVPDIKAPNARAAAHTKLGFDTERGGVVVLRPDGHIACTLQLVEGNGTVDALNEYFGAFASKALGDGHSHAKL
ncbi:FAD monooxygenase [Blastomyces dermatitidis ER-3]|uniref:FAD monooxygenase n=1 Tax=Ajellomyces dermatitidis (strain ER-3 / ATCC MYA-2586) TaxID=559297 RepID=A0ABP2F6E3_AJEDR|nr:FAD monooxygenase [Blastomyces dermatitidis ER-3]EEQ90998.2 FAD monooxygenase [Blastomyces dermatitidis ER-3]